MKKVLGLIILYILLTTSGTIAQTAQVARLTIADGDSISTSIVLKENVMPVAVWTDSLTTNTTLKIQVGFNGSTTTAPTTFYNTAIVSDTTIYSINLRTKRVIPLEPRNFYSVIGTYLDQSTHIWLRVVLGVHQHNGKYIYVRLARF